MEGQKEIISQLITFADTYYYPDTIKEKLEFMKDFGFIIHYDVIRQILFQFGLLEDKYNIYQKFLDLVKENFELGQNIVEFGGGLISVLAKLIAKEQQKLNKGSIITYDHSLLVKDKIDRLTQIKETFTQHTDIKDANLLLSLCPCLGTETFISSASSNNKEYALALCNCDHYADPYDDSILETEDWKNNMISLARDTKSLGHYLTLAKLPDLYGDLDVIISKKRKFH